MTISGIVVPKKRGMSDTVDVEWCQGYNAESKCCLYQVPVLEVRVWQLAFCESDERQSHITFSPEEVRNNSSGCL